MIDESRPIFMQIAELIENDIVDGALAEESQVPSTNEFAAFYRINPATAAKGVNRLVDDVVTSGASVSRAATVLREAGATRVVVVAIARTPLKTTT